MPSLLPLSILAFLGNLAGGDLIICGFVPLAMICSAWMLFDAATKEPTEGSDRLIWVLIILFAPIIGGAIYYLARRPERIRKYGR